MSDPRPTLRVLVPDGRRRIEAVEQADKAEPLRDHRDALPEQDGQGEEQGHHDQRCDDPGAPGGLVHRVGPVHGVGQAEAGRGVASNAGATANAGRGEVLTAAGIQCETEERRG